MTEKHDYTASVRRKGLENTGVTQDIAKHMFNTQGRSTLAIVELRHKRKIDDDDTGRGVELVIEALEPSQETSLDDHLRQLMRTMHQNRVLHSEDQALDIEVAGDLEPSVDAVIAAQRAHAAGEPHIFEPTDDGDEDGGTCWCGEAFEADVHAVVGSTLLVPAGLDGDDLDAWVSGDVEEGDETANPERWAAYLERKQAYDALIDQHADTDEETDA